MLDLTKAALVVGATYALVEWLKSVVPFRLTPRWQVFGAVVAGQTAVWGLATTVWAHAQVIGGVSLDNLNSGSKVAAGFFVGLLASGSERLIAMGRNFGENEVKRPVAK
jgi:hypothetical protein